MIFACLPGDQFGVDCLERKPESGQPRGPGMRRCSKDCSNLTRSLHGSTDVYLK